jgi:ATP-binding cassette subfamily B protein
VTAPARSNGWLSGWRVARYYPRRYLLGGAVWALVAMLPLAPGLLLKAAFDRIAHGRAAGGSALSVLAVLAAVELTRSAVLWTAIVGWTRWWATVAAWLRANLLAGVLLGSGPPSARLPGSAGEAVSRFRDDVDDVIWLTDGWVDLAGAVVLGVVGVTIMVSIHPLFALAVVVPLVTIVFLTRWLSNRLRRLHRGLRESGAAVTSFVADVFGAATTIKLAGAEDRTLTRFRLLNVSRAGAAVRAEVATSLLENVSSATTEISTGVLLLLAASAMRRGDFTVGDLALFTSYASALTFLPRRTGHTMARARAAAVSTERLARILPESGEAGVFAPRPVYIGSTPPAPAARADRVADDALECFEARGLTASAAIGARTGIRDVDVEIRASELVVVTGAVGAGKTTLVRALLGLTALDAGTIHWNHKPVDDPGLDLVPPRIAYVAQVPRLFSASLVENVTLGWQASGDDLDASLRLAALADDVDDMPDGVDTLVGPRGMRLSGGQAQRAAAARALVRQPDLLVVDDLSSALDPQTEMHLWTALAARAGACLAVSHRPAVLEKADRIIVLEAGRVAAAGSYAEVQDCAEFRRLRTTHVFGDA